MLADTIRVRGVFGLYSGSGALIAGTGLKAGVRFMTYDTIKGWLTPKEVRDKMGLTI